MTCHTGRGAALSEAAVAAKHAAAATATAASSAATAAATGRCAAARRLASDAVAAAEQALDYDAGVPVASCQFSDHRATARLP